MSELALRAGVCIEMEKEGRGRRPKAAFPYQKCATAPGPKDFLRECKRMLR